MKKITYYISDDGKIFEKEEHCFAYENNTNEIYFFDKDFNQVSSLKGAIFIAFKKKDSDKATYGVILENGNHFFAGVKYMDIDEEIGNLQTAKSGMEKVFYE